VKKASAALLNQPKHRAVERNSTDSYEGIPSIDRAKFDKSRKDKLSQRSKSKEGQKAEYKKALEGLFGLQRQ